MTADPTPEEQAREIVAKAFRTHARERCPGPSMIDCAECCACHEGEQLIVSALRAARIAGRREVSPTAPQIARDAIASQVAHDAVGICRDLLAVLEAQPWPSADVRWLFLQQRAEAVVRALALPDPATGGAGAPIDSRDPGALARPSESQPEARSRASTLPGNSPICGSCSGGWVVLTQLLRPGRPAKFTACPSCRATGGDRG